MNEDLGAPVPGQALAVPVEPASGLAPPGFDPSRLVLEHFSKRPLVRVRSTKQWLIGDKDWNWRGKPKGLWVSVKGEMDWREWCEAESFGLDRLKWRSVITLSSVANILHIRSVGELDAFDELYGRDERIGTSDYSKRIIDWEHVAKEYDGILIAPYQWERRFDGRVSDWYYGWDCASGVIWNARAIASCDTHPEGGDANAAPFMSGAVPEGQAPNLQPDNPHD